MKKLIIGTVFIAVLGLVFGAMNIYNAPAASVILDVNPSIEVVTNRLDTVIEVRALNDDADEMLEDYQLQDRDIDNVVNELVDLMISSGYITGGEDNLVMLTVYEEDADQEMLDKMNKQIRAYLDNQKISATILNQVANKSNDDLDIEVSTGKRDLINKLVNSDDELNYNDLASISIRDIMIMSESMGLSPEDLFVKVVEKVEQNTFDENNYYITAEEAKSIAIEMTDGGQVVEFEIDEDDSEAYYEIEVISESGKYEIEIDATSGQVIKFELDEEYMMLNQEVISRDRAIEIAKEISGEGQVEIEFDEDDEKYIYEVEIENQTGEYEIVIDAITGEVIELEVDEEYEMVNQELISKDEAIEIVKEISGDGQIDIELDDDDEKYIYEVEVENETGEYEIVIDAVSGEVIELEIDEEYEEAEEYEENVGELISEEEAKSIALQESNGGNVEDIELDEDDGQYIYEIEIVKDEMEYEFEINAHSGEIIKMEIDD